MKTGRETDRLNQISRFLSLILRHRPDQIGIQLDKSGWVETEELLAASKVHGFAISQCELEQVVQDSDKRRFALTADGSYIRANQGHSISIDLGYEPAQPPDVLYHGTNDMSVASIAENGLVKGSRHHVHLSLDLTTALKVGQRRGKPVVFKVAACAMYADGHVFFQSANGVWLTDKVPAKYLECIS